MTAPPTAPIDIVNLALLQLFEAPITSFEDTENRAAVASSRIYDYRRQALLRNHTWNFARDRKEIPVSSEVPPFDYLSIYELPEDLLKLHHLGTEWDQWFPFPYDVQGRKVLVNQADITSIADVTPPLKIEYTKDITDVSLFDALFLDVLVFDLAAHLAMPVTGDARMAQLHMANYRQKLAEAVAINHQERRTRVIQRDPIREGRMLGADIWDGQVNVPPSAWP